jgi:hypothetical protein
MLFGGRDCRTQFWKGITNGPFHQSLAKWFQRRIFLELCTDGRPTQSDDKGSPDPLGQVILKKKGCILFPIHGKISKNSWLQQ